ncbi:DUF1615 domain-containing protein [Laribacter hongkongensis]|uniref:DUF1615 domain-containing protein n=1 Tax=Laribacter hongkongensis TaxID=168471 RepID=UPI001EFD9DF3|nr:DUF1615 domain-containing protein [Laribacter hongkongensis]MCG9078243.1 DUF1615 domain-containing protein [Laribacter hongkongensis]
MPQVHSPSARTSLQCARFDPIAIFMTSRLLPLSFVLALLAGCATQTPAPVLPAAPAPVPAPVPQPVTPPPAPVPPPAAEPVAPPRPAAVMPGYAPYPNEAAARAAVSRLLPARVRDRAGWTQDIVGAFTALRLPYRPDYFCAAMAIIEQESLWQADPVVPGLGKMVWKEIDKRREKYAIPKLVVDAAMLKSSPDGRSYRERIDALKTEREMNALFGDMIDELPFGRTLLADKNPIRTGGPMQVSVAFAEEQIREKPYPYPKKGPIRDEVFSRRGGLYFGIAILLDYPAPYSDMRYRFADFNAGRYASRNAAFQLALGRLAGERIAPDGDLMRYSGGDAVNGSQTQRAVLAMAGTLGLSSADINRDLRLEKRAAFTSTATWKQVFALADRRFGHQPREAMPQIDLSGPKIQRKLTTEWFANRVDGRYRSCLARR